MMTPPNKPRGLQAGFPSFTWATGIDVFCSEAAISDPAVGKSISTGIREALFM